MEPVVSLGEDMHSTQKVFSGQKWSSGESFYFWVQEKKCEKVTMMSIKPTHISKAMSLYEKYTLWLVSVSADVWPADIDLFSNLNTLDFRVKMCRMI